MNSKRIHKKPRRTKRIQKKMRGGLGGSDVLKSSKKVAIGQITSFESLNGFTVSDDVVKFKYTVKIDGDKIVLSDISKFTSTQSIGVFLSIVSLSPTKFSSFDAMTRVFYNIDIPWSIMGDSHHLTQGQAETGNSMQAVLNAMNNYFDPMFREGKYLGAIPKKIVFSANAIDVTVKDEEQPTLDIPVEFQDGFKNNVMNYFRKLVDPEYNGKMPANANGSAIPTSGLTPIEDGDKEKIRQLIPDARFEGMQLVTKSTIQKDASGKFYATATEYKVECK
jgi:hypothetical protein